MGIYEIRTKARTGKWNLEGAEYTQTYDVVADINDDQFTLLSNFVTSSGQTPGNYYNGTFLVDFDANQLNTDASTHSGHNQTALWEVKILYKNLTPAEQEKAEKVEPLNRLPVFSFQTRETEEIVEEDNSGNAIVNSRGDAYNPGLTKRKGAGVLIVKKNFAFPLPFDPGYYSFKTNINAMLGYPVSALLCTNISVDQESTTIGDLHYQYNACSFEFEIDAENLHQLKPLDQGFYQNIPDPSDSSKTIKAHIKDDLGLDITEPSLLDGNGKSLSTVTTGTPPTPVFNEHDVYKQADFVALLRL